MAQPSDIQVISDQWGAPGMAFVGDVRLQSYLTELSLGSLTHPLSRYTSPGRMQPTGSEYDRYAREVLEASGVSRCEGRVEDMRRIGDRFVLSVRTAAGPQVVRASQLVLATGSRQRPAPPPWPDTGVVVSCDQAFRDIDEGRIASYAFRNALVVGSGNSAMQLAALLAPACRQVAVLANKYLGMYPTETSDRYAWRAGSQLTWELVVKSSGFCWAADGTAPCVRFLIYRTLTAADGNAMFTYSAADNQHQMGSHSLPPNHPHIHATKLVGGDDHWREEWPLSQTTVVWATGRDPVYPPSSLLSSLPRDERGVLLTGAGGQAPVPGLFLAGSCAGQRAVNEMMAAPTGTPQHAYQAKNPPAAGDALILGHGTGGA